MRAGDSKTVSGSYDTASDTDKSKTTEEKHWSIDTDSFKNIEYKTGLDDEDNPFSYYESSDTLTVKTIGTPPNSGEKVTPYREVISGKTDHPNPTSIADNSHPYNTEGTYFEVDEVDPATVAKEPISWESITGGIENPGYFSQVGNILKAEVLFAIDTLSFGYAETSDDASAALDQAGIRDADLRALPEAAGRSFGAVAQGGAAGKLIGGAAKVVQRAPKAITSLVSNPAAQRAAGLAGEVLDKSDQAQSALDLARSAYQGDIAGVIESAADLATGRAADGPRSHADDVPNAEKLRRANDEINVIQPDGYCFTSDTPVATPKGLRPIGELRKGDFVLAFDHASGTWSPRRVEGVHDNVYEDSLVTVTTTGGDSFRATVHHPVWVLNGRELEARPTPAELNDREDQGQSLPGRWVNSHDLRPGDVLIDRHGQQQYVRRIEQEFVTNTPVFNLTVEQDHTYAVGNVGLLVHNSCADPQKASAEVVAPKASPELAREIADVEKPPLNDRRTVAITETREGVTLVSGGASDLSEAQKRLARERGLTPTNDLPRADAEITMLDHAGRNGLTPTNGVTTNDICPTCAGDIEGLGGVLTGPRSFSFPLDL
ncbi:hypothetical protein Pla123a_19600 [Posidoniimonas polymericola]|uniref:Hint domain-containing protein n=1 Tax=Posidoniimonas polymericola TaxID=2528002 RepID=A0A5C5YQR9_9BACT|nr:Hint domain-containing protein [Posidoniimonas polymericola]TWT77302.1 hypothetical protein Pla123a_19600 [Posidoniimonas polymericola]